jgi:microcystin-dependent protein
MDPFIGTICAFGFNYAPADWQYCNGAVLNVQQYQGLFALLSNNFGGNGQTNFAVPNLLGCTAIGQGTGPDGTDYVIADNGGSENITITSANLPQHTHAVSLAVQANSSTASAAAPTGAFPGNSSGINANIYAANSNGTMAMLPSMTLSTYTGATGTTADIRRPYLALNYCIALLGYFPVRQ